MEEIIAALLVELLSSLVEQGIKYLIKKGTDSLGNAISQIVAVFDDDGDGVSDREEVLFEFDVSVPDLSDKFSIVNRDDELGLGYPQLEIVPASDLPSFIDGATIIGNDNCLLIDDDVYCPLPLDYDGDGLPDWGRVIDEDHNGVPDAAPDVPFYPVGSDAYNQIISEDSGKSLIIVSPDGNIAVYDPSGELQYEDYNEAYSLWLQDNAALDKPFKYYSVTEALLLIVAVFAGVSLVGKLFKRRYYNGHH